MARNTPRTVAAAADIDERYFVESTARTVGLLLAIANIDGPASLPMLVTELGWSKPMVYRLVRTLETVGALRQQDGGYVLGPTMITLGQSALRATRLLDIARPALEELHDLLDETSVLTVLDGDEIVYLDRVEADKLLIPRTRLGSRLPAYCTSTGHVLLAGLTDQEIRTRLAGRKFEKLGPNTLTTIEALLERMQSVRRDGYALNDEELTVGHRAIAAPVRDHTGAVAAAISISVPAARVTRAELKRIATEVLVPATDRVSASLGAKPQSRFRPRSTASS
jgi:IclR family transcriptional regulator, pca regulon regulatory protein